MTLLQKAASPEAAFFLGASLNRVGRIRTNMALGGSVMKKRDFERMLEGLRRLTGKQLMRLSETVGELHSRR